jgi:hypothetical protein
MIGSVLKGMLKAGFDTAEIASFCNRHPDLFPDFRGRPLGNPFGLSPHYPIRESDVWNQMASADHLDLTQGDAA